MSEYGGVCKSNNREGCVVRCMCVPSHCCQWQGSEVGEVVCVMVVVKVAVVAHWCGGVMCGAKCGGDVVRDAVWWLVR